jgi:RNA polymerase sigma-70 factor, ECF subfamily
MPETFRRVGRVRVREIPSRHPSVRPPPEAELDDDDLALADGQRADASIDKAGVRAAMAALPAPQRQVLAEVYYRDRSVAETARILQIPPGTVRSRTFYGLRALRRSLAAQDAVA